ncbi:helicase-associated domain-containing protein [Leucobacter rhizosphaerae]|uniref:Helicase-associated domain-containing protein n=1 Tax=Leucobacter rhizosphaerae TaxID=2932245 RepID=A0ABY4FUK3_9MICO|nr:helicase-associated domain-containing protein [Leucobacter rhizosphaerae]UOQ59968.1 helicase-associated domain-containing protein [Leucobacter rhizosphaerae]
MSGTLALASAIAGMDRETLSALVLQRRPQAAAGVSDPIGLASELLRADAVQRILAPLDTTRLAALLRLADADPESVDPALVDELTRLGLVGTDDGRPAALPEVTEAIRSGLATAGVEIDPSNLGPVPELEGDPVHDTSVWYASAVTAVGQAAEILRLVLERPGRLNRNGSIAVATIRLIAESSSVEFADASFALRALERAGLITASKASQLLLAAPGASDWLAASYGDRWVALAEAALAKMPAPVRGALDATPAHLTEAVELLPHRFPLLPAAELAAAAEFARSAEHLGLTVEGALSDPARALLDGDAAAARAVLARDLPAIASGIYVQPDLSLVVPGPLAPEDEAEIAALSRPEHVGVATTRRVTEASLADAIERGATVESARAAFTRLSLTGMPQPLDYLLTSLADRVGTIVVADHLGDEGRTRVTVSRPELGQTILVDRSLQHVQFTLSTSNRGVLYSRLRPEHVIAALTDARYPASLASARLETRPIPRLDGPSGPVDSGALAPELATLVDRVFLAARSEPGTGDFTRLLELAIRERGTVRVTAEARGQVHVFTLLPVSLSGGRLRATDAAAGMERTLPVSTITAVETI